MADKKDTADERKDSKDSISLDKLLDDKALNDAIARKVAAENAITDAVAKAAKAEADRKAREAADVRKQGQSSNEFSLFAGNPPSSKPSIPNDPYRPYVDPRANNSPYVPPLNYIPPNDYNHMYPNNYFSPGAYQPPVQRLGQYAGYGTSSSWKSGRKNDLVRKIIIALALFFGGMALFGSDYSPANKSVQRQVSYKTGITDIMNDLSYRVPSPNYADMLSGTNKERTIHAPSIEEIWK